MKRGLLLFAAFWTAGCTGSRPTGVSPRAIEVRFREAARQAGIDFVHSHGGQGKKYFVETSGAGAAFFDYDNDGDPDLYVVQSGALPGAPGFGSRANRSALYRNRGDGTFEDVTEIAGVGNYRYGQGCAAGDYDADGDLDLFVTNFGKNRLYRNNGDGTFTDVAVQAAVQGSGYSTSAAFCDVDVDGDLDLYVARYARYRLGIDPYCSQAPGLHSYCPPAQFDGDVDLFYRNNGDGTFTEQAKEAGLDDPRGRGLGVVFFDFNDDGLPDLYVANDGTLNRLYENLGRGRFKDITIAAGVGMSENGILAAGMGTDAADFDGDGRFDIFVANFTNEPNDLYRNRGDGAFEIWSMQSGLGAPSLPHTGFGAAALDFDLDGLMDILVANGHVADDIQKADPNTTYPQPDSLYRNLGGGRFADVSRAAGLDADRPTVSRGLALADIDGDGDLDAFVNNCGGPPSLFINEGGNAHNWLKLQLRAARGEPFGIGARLTVEVDGRRQVRELRSGASYCSQSDMTLVIGLGTAVKADRVRVRWPGRGEEEWRDLAAGQLHRLEERIR